MKSKSLFLLLALSSSLIFCGCASLAGKKAASPAKAPAGKNVPPPTAAAPAKTAPKAVKKGAPAKTVKKALVKAAAVPFPALSHKDSWSMVVVPDIQTYIKQIENQGILDMMLAWIVRRRAEMNIQQVFFTGDLVYANDHGTVEQPKGVRFARSGYLRDLVAGEQWKATSRLLERLDGEVPYILCTGNHDYGSASAENRRTLFPRYFPTDRNPLTRRQLVNCAPDASGVRSQENAAYEFTAPHPDGRKFLVITLQFAPTDKVLKWAREIAAQPRFADHIGIVLTHSYMRANGKRIVRENYSLNRAGGNPGEGIFQKLIYPSKNIRLVLCGHVCRQDDWTFSAGFSVDKNHIGKTVAQMVFNPQAIGGGYSGNGGDGWLRILEFLPDRKTVKATTFSPFFFGSPSTQHLAWRTEPRNSFTFTLE